MAPTRAMTATPATIPFASVRRAKTTTYSSNAAAACPIPFRANRKAKYAIRQKPNASMSSIPIPPTQKSLKIHPNLKSPKIPRLANKIRAKIKLRLSNATMAHLTKSHAANCSMSQTSPKFAKVANASSTQPLHRAPCHSLPLANKIRVKTKIRLSNATMVRQPKSHAMKSSTTMTNRRSATMAHVSRHSAQKTFAAIAKRS